MRSSLWRRTLLIPLASLLLATLFLLITCNYQAQQPGVPTKTLGALIVARPMTAHLGQRVTLGNRVAMTVINALTLSLIEGAPLAPGRVVLMIGVEEHNLSAQPLAISSLYQFNLFDSLGRSYPHYALPPSFIAPPAQSIASGETTQGNIAFEVSPSVHRFTLTFSANLIVNTPLSWDIHV